jgi:hypothetical protein
MKKGYQDTTTSICPHEMRYKQRPFTKKGKEQKLCDNPQQARGLQLKITDPGINHGVCPALPERTAI